MLKLAQHLRVVDYTDPSLYLQAVYDATKQTNARCSYEAFSERLGFGFNTYVHQAISGRRPISAKAAQRLADALGLTGTSRRYLLTICAYKHSRSARAREEALAELLRLRKGLYESDLDRGQVEYLSEWYHAVVRELVSLPDFDPAPSWIAARVQPALKVEQAEASFRLLCKIGYVVFDETAARWRVAAADVRTPADVRSLAVARFHQVMIGLAAESVDRVAAPARDIGALTMTLTAEQFAAVKQLLRDMRRQVADLGQAPRTDEQSRGAQVYQLNVQLFPVSQGESA